MEEGVGDSVPGLGSAGADVEDAVEVGVVEEEKGAVEYFFDVDEVAELAAVGVLGLIPLAIGFGEGTELLKPMAISVIGGLLFSLFLTFYFMPAAFLLIMNKKEETWNREQ